MEAALKRLYLVHFVILAFCSMGLAQYQLPALERAKQIKFLQHDRDAVRQILDDYNLDASETSDEFSFGDTTVEVTYSTGKCDEDEDEIWDVPEGRAIRIEISADSELKVEDLDVDLSMFEKEQMYADNEDEFIYHSKKNGFAIKVDDGVIDRFILFPPVKGKAKTCKSKSAKEFVSSKSWFGKLKLSDRNLTGCFSADVIDLSLNRQELTVLDSKKEILVSVTAIDPENDVLTYGYTVSFGKIIGKGDKVVWDLSGAGMGAYTITAAVDDGCGYCGKTATKTVVIK